MSERGTFSLSMPNSFLSSSVIARRRSGFTPATSSMYGRIVVELEPVAHVFAQHRRRERPERLAVLHLQVEHLLHARRARIAQDGPGAERARAELHAPLEPAQRLLRDQRIGRLRDHAGIVNHAEPGARRPQALLDFDLLELRAEVGAAHAVESAVRPARLILEQVVGAQRRADRAAGIARRRLDPDALETAVTQDLAVRDAVERDAARQAQVALAGLARDARASCAA